MADGLYPSVPVRIDPEKTPFETQMERDHNAREFLIAVEEVRPSAAPFAVHAPRVYARPPRRATVPPRRATLRRVLRSTLSPPPSPPTNGLIAPSAAPSLGPPPAACR